MNHVERFLAVMNFQPVDRLPRIEWAGWWNKTIDRWHGEGLPAKLTDAFDIRQNLGLDPYKQAWLSPRAATCPPPPGHGMPIISGMDEYLAVLPHLYPPTVETIESMRPWAEAQSRGELVVWVTFEGFFWFPRALLGIEPHLYAFYDQPELIHRINTDLAAHTAGLLAQLVKACVPTFVTFAEDMSYNHGPMLSKQQFDQFIAPYYRQIIPLLGELNILPIVDSDGDVSVLAGWLQEVGIKGVLPLERQAGVDAAGLRAAYPKLRMIGHYDKMVMPHGETAMRAEFERLLPAARKGGFIPSVDHQTPPGVSLELYRCYLRLLEEFSVRAAG